MSRVTSRKLTYFKYGSAVILSWLFLNIFCSSFLSFSAFCLESLWHPRPSSLYKPTLSVGNLVLMQLRRYSPTNSQISAPWDEPIVTSKSPGFFLPTFHKTDSSFLEGSSFFLFVFC